MMKDEFVEILSKKYWFKAVEMLQQNWALIESSRSGKSCVVYFIDDTSGVFDQIEFAEITEAEKQLQLNGFAKYEDDEEAMQFISSPPPPFHISAHPNGPIYSSGRFWKTK